MITRNKKFLSDGIRSRWTWNFRNRPLKRSTSRRQGTPRWVSAEIDRLEDRTLLTANPIADQFLVNETLDLEASPPAVAVQEGTGDFVVAWTSFEQPPEAGLLDVTDTNGLGVYVQVFNANGDAKTRPVLANVSTDGDQTGPAVAIDANGKIIVTWESLSEEDADSDGLGVFARVFSIEPLTGDDFEAELQGGSELLVNTETAGDQEAPAIAVDNAGNFIIAWQSFGQDGDGYGIYARRFDSDGVALDTVEFLVNETTEGNQTNPTIAAAQDNGNFVIGWEGEVLVGEESVEIFAHLYEEGGSMDPDEFQVNTVTPRDQVTPDVAMDADGDFVFTWTSEGQTGSGADVFAQRFDTTGTSVGNQFRVNETTLQGQRNAAVAMDADGDFFGSSG